MIEKKADIDAIPKIIDFDAIRPIHFACHFNFLDIIKYLIKSGANIGKGPYKYAPLQVCCGEAKKFADSFTKKLESIKNDSNPFTPQEMALIKQGKAPQETKEMFTILAGHLFRQDKPQLLFLLSGFFKKSNKQQRIFLSP